MDTAQIREIITQYLQTAHTAAYWFEDASARAVMELIYRQDIWDGDFRARYPAVRDKQIPAMDAAEIRTVLTWIACMERTHEGTFDESIRSGRLEALLRRWLALLPRA